MKEEKKTVIEYFNDDQFRNNLESALTGLVAIFIVILTKGFISGFSLDLFLTLEPYASGLGIMIATSLLQNNMIIRGFYDEIDNNEDIKTELGTVEKLDKQITDYDYAEHFVSEYNKTEFNRLQKIVTDTEVRKLKYVISVKKSLGRKYTKYQRKLDYVKEYGGTVKKYKKVSVQDLLSFQSDGELKGADKLNFKAIEMQRKKLARNKFVMFALSGVIAGLPLVAGDVRELLLFLLVWIPTLAIKSFKVYANSRRVTKTTYYKSLQYKKNVLTLCVDSYKHWIPPVENSVTEEDYTNNQVVLQIKKDTD